MPSLRTSTGAVLNSHRIATKLSGLWRLHNANALRSPDSTYNKRDITWAVAPSFTVATSPGVATFNGSTMGGSAPAACLTGASLVTGGSMYVRFTCGLVNTIQQLMSARGGTNDIEILIDNASARLVCGSYASTFCKTPTNSLVVGNTYDVVVSWGPPSSGNINILCWLFQNGAFTSVTSGASLTPTSLTNPVGIGARATFAQPLNGQMLGAATWDGYQLGASEAFWLAAGGFDELTAAASKVRRFMKSAGGAAHAAGTLSSPSQTGTTVSLSYTGDTGGTSPYSYQYQHQTHPSGGYSTDATHTAQTSSDTLTVSGLTPGTSYDFKVNGTDAASDTKTSNVLTVSTATPAAGTLTAPTDNYNSVGLSVTTPTNTAGGPFTLVYKRTAAGDVVGGTYSVLATHSGVSSFPDTYTDSSVSPAGNLAYWYKVDQTDSASNTYTTTPIQVTTPTATAGTLSFTKSGSTVSFASTAASNMGGPITSQLQKNTGAGFSNVSGQSTTTSDGSFTSGTLQDTSGPGSGQTYTYQIIQTPTTGSAATSNTLSVSGSVSDPANPYKLSSHPMYATMRAFVAHTSSVAGSLPVEYVNRTVCRPFPGVSSVSSQTGLGPIPDLNSHNDGTHAGNMAKWIIGAPMLIAPASVTSPNGIAIQGTGGVVPTSLPTVFCTFIPGIVDSTQINSGGTLTYSPGSDTPSAFQLVASERSGGGYALALVNVSGSWKAQWFDCFGYNDLGLPALNGAHEYAFAVSVLTSTTIKAFLYDITSQTLITASGGTAVTTSGTMRTVTDQFLTANPLGNFWGKMRVWGMDLETWTDSLFSSFYGDDIGFIRGTAPTGGTLTAGDGYCESLDTGNLLHCSTPINGSPSVAGTYTYQWYYASTPITTSTGATLITGATSRAYLDTSAPVASERFYICAQSDGTNTVYTQCVVGCRLRGLLKMLWVGNSELQYGTTVTNFGLTARSAGYAVHSWNVARGGTSAQQWDPINPGGSTVQQPWLATSLSMANYMGLTTCFYEHGTNDVPSSSLTGFYGYVARACDAIRAAGLTTWLSNPPYRKDSIAGEANNVAMRGNLLAVGSDPTNFPSLVRGTNVLPCDTNRGSASWASSPYLLLDLPESGNASDTGEHGTAMGYVTKGSGAFIAALANILEPNSGGGTGSGGPLGCSFIRGA